MLENAYPIGMLKYIEWLTRRRRTGRGGRPPAADVCRRWWADPLSHPDLQRMSPHQLADLPFDPARIHPGPDPSRGGGR